MSDDRGSAFVKGGCGCLLAFFAIGMVFVLLGGSMQINLGGAILLFVIGGVIGLVVLSVYSKGQRDVVDRGGDFREQQASLEQPVRTDVSEASRAERHCPYCGARVTPATGEGSICENCRNKIEPAR